jgi:hypothetical protein
MKIDVTFPEYVARAEELFEEMYKLCLALSNRLDTIEEYLIEQRRRENDEA